MSHEIKASPRKLRTANETLNTAQAAKPPAALFDSFWAEGELAILFGPTGVGKSLLAVDLAERLASGRVAEGEVSESAGRAVLYVDFVLSDAQFAMRYSATGAGGSRRPYRFANRLYRDCPPAGENLAAWLRDVIADGGVEVVVIDDVSRVPLNGFGMREPLQLMCELRRMTRETGVSVLVLAGSTPSQSGRDAGEWDLRRRRALCPYADSVFGMAACGATDVRQLVHTRSSGREIVWTSKTPGKFEIVTGEDGFVGFEPVECELTHEEAIAICRVKELRDRGETFRAIADTLEMSKSKAARLYAKWSPAVAEAAKPLSPWQAAQPAGSPEPELPEADRLAAAADAIGVNDLDKPSDEPPIRVEAGPSPTASSEQPDSPAPEPVPPPGYCRVTDLPAAIDGYGEEIRVESWHYYLNRPEIWYKRRPNNDRWTRNDRTPGYVKASSIDPSGIIPIAEVPEFDKSEGQWIGRYCSD